MFWWPCGIRRMEWRIISIHDSKQTHFSTVSAPLITKRWTHSRKNVCYGCILFRQIPGAIPKEKKLDKMVINPLRFMMFLGQTLRAISISLGEKITLLFLSSIKCTHSITFTFNKQLVFLLSVSLYIGWKKAERKWQAQGQPVAFVPNQD